MPSWEGVLFVRSESWPRGAPSWCCQPPSSPLAFGGVESESYSPSGGATRLRVDSGDMQEEGPPVGPRGPPAGWEVAQLPLAQGRLAVSVAAGRQPGPCVAPCGACPCTRCPDWDARKQQLPSHLSHRVFQASWSVTSEMRACKWTSALKTPNVYIALVRWQA